MKLLQKNTLTSAAALIAGGLGAKLVYNKAAFIKDPKLRAGLPLLIGLFLSTQKEPMMKNLGFGMIVSGGTSLVGSFVPALSGIDADEVLDGVYEATDENVNYPLNGEEEFMSEFDYNED